jgi:hypothetical protein
LSGSAVPVVAVSIATSIRTVAVAYTSLRVFRPMGRRVAVAMKIKRMLWQYVEPELTDIFIATPNDFEPVPSV